MDALLDWEEARFKQWAAAPRMAVRPVSAGLPSPAHPLAAIVPIKAPLSTIYESRYGGEVSGFTVSHVVQRMQTAQLRVLAVMDATGQAGYLHTVKEWAEWDIHYVKLGTGSSDGGVGGGSSSGGGGASGGEALGNDSPPTQAMYTSFSSLVTECLTKDPKGVVLVFDEYGYNRSGALIVRHLVEACGIAPWDALAALGKCRAPGLYSSAALAWALASLGPDAAKGLAPAAAPTWDKRTDGQRSAWCVISQPLPPAFATQALTTLEDDCGAVSLSIPGGTVVSTAVEGEGEVEDAVDSGVFEDAEPVRRTGPPLVPVMGPPRAVSTAGAGSSATLPPPHSGGGGGGGGSGSVAGGSGGSGGGDPREGPGSVKRARTSVEDRRGHAAAAQAAPHTAAADGGPPPPATGAALLPDAANPFGVGAVVAPGSTLYAWVASKVQRLCKQPLERLCDPARWVLASADVGTLARPAFSSKHMLTWRPVGVDCLVLLCPVGFALILPQAQATVAVVTATLPHALMDTVIDGTVVTEPGPAGATTTRLLVGDALVVGGKLMTGRELHARLGHMIELVMKPLRQVIDNGSLVLPLRVRDKTYVKARAVGSLLTSTIPSLPHRCSGVVVVHTDGTHALHSDAMGPGVAPVLWPVGGAGSSVSQEELQAACTAP